MVAPLIGAGAALAAGLPIVYGAGMARERANSEKREKREKKGRENASEMKRESRNEMKSTSKSGQKLTAQERQMMQEVEDKKNQPKIDEAYEKSRTTFKQGGSVSKRADGCAQRGKTNCKMR
jgi:uncharacterized protein HemX